MLKNIGKSVILVAAGLSILGSSPAMANWRTGHPRRAEVNARLRNLDHRIRAERREGDLTGAQARYMRREDRTIRQEERDMARYDNSHITRADQRALNQQENALNRQIPN